MHSLGGPTIVGNAAYGVTSGGGSYCRNPYSKFDEGGCGTFYRFDRDGHFQVIRTFGSDAIGPFGTLASSPGSPWLYGTSGINRMARPALYRVSLGGKFNVVATPGGLFSPAATDGVDIYVVATPSFGESTTLERVNRAGKIEALATFANRFGVYAPIVESDNSIAVALNDRACGETIAVVRGPNVHTLFSREVAGRSDGRCFRSGEPTSGLATTPEGLVSTNPHEAIEIGLDGSRKTLARLPRSLGNFVGGVVAANGAMYALSASASRADPVCTRLLRIQRDSQISVVHEFTWAEGRCIDDGDFVVPRLAVDGSEFVVTTSSFEDCLKKARSKPGTCGSILRLSADGSEIAAHDFVQEADPLDNPPNITTALNATGRMLQVYFVRPGPPSALPFTIDADGISVVATDGRGRRHLIAGKTTGTLASHFSLLHPWDSTRQQLLSLDFPLPDDLPADAYDIVLDRIPAARTTDGHPVRVDASTVAKAYVPSASNADVEALRRRYLGQYVYEFGNGIDDGCLAPQPLTRNVPKKIVAIQRLSAPETLFTWYDGYQPFLAIEPILVSFAPPGDACGGRSRTIAGTWQFERLYTLRDPIDSSWPHDFRVAATDERPIVGMTRAMVAAIWGYPGGFGTAAELFRRQEWDYGSSSATVDFRGDRVTSVSGNI